MSKKLLGIVCVTILAGLVSTLAIGAARTPSEPVGGVIDPSCSSTLPCIEYDNNAAGAAIRGVSAAGVGVAGWTKNNSTSAANGWAGVYGKDISTSGSFNSGVKGITTRGTGVSGTATSGTGVNGTSTDGNGVSGTTTNNAGVVGTSINDIGVYGASTNYLGTYGQGATYGIYGFSSAHQGVEGVSSSGTGVYASSFSGRGLEAHTSSGLGAYVINGSGNGGDVTGTYIGVVARATSFPLVLTDPVGNNLFFVDGSGNVSYHGTLTHFAATRTGKSAIIFGATTTSPTVEDTGSGQLISGIALVQLDPAFVQTIDPRAPYHVMLTPDGDTRGLFVASKGPNSFVVREVQGGRGSLSFDYHIYAAALGHANERMSIMTRAVSSSLEPKAPIIRQSSKPTGPIPLR